MQPFAGACAQSATLSAPAVARGATAGGRAGTAHECALPKPAWLWCDDFDTDRLAQYFEYSPGEAAFVRAPGEGRGGSYAMAAHYNPTRSDAGSLKVAFGKVPDRYFRPVDSGTTAYRDVYWRWYILHPTTWLGGGPDKMTRALGIVTAAWAQSVLGHVWDGANDKLYLDPASGTDVSGAVRTTAYNDFAHLRWLGATASATNIYDAAHLGRWVCIEAHLRLNDVGRPNGVFQLWIDGAMEASLTRLNWLGSYSGYGINAVFFENYWNDRSPVAQTRYWDNIVVSTERIGCDMVAVGRAPPVPPLKRVADAPRRDASE